MAFRQSSEHAAIDLLRTIVSDEEWKRFQRTGTLEIRGKAGIYRVDRRHATRLLDSETQRAIATIRWHPVSPEEVPDRVIAEYLLIRNSENRYWETANILPDKSGPNLYHSFLVAALDIMLLMVLLSQLH